MGIRRSCAPLICIDDKFANTITRVPIPFEVLVIHSEMNERNTANYVFMRFSSPFPLLPFRFDRNFYLFVSTSCFFFFASIHSYSLRWLLFCAARLFIDKITRSFIS